MTQESTNKPEAADGLNTASQTPETPDPPPMNLPVAVDVRSLSLALLAVIASIFVLQWASAVFVPLLLSVLFTYALSPPVDWLAERWHVPRALGAGVLMIAIMGGLGGTAYALADDATNLVETLPEAAQKLRQSMRARTQKESTMDKVQKAATQLEQAAAENSAPVPVTRGVVRVQVEKPHFNIKDYFMTGTLSAFAAVGQAAVVIFLTFFLLASGDTFRRKMVRIAGDKFANRKLTVQALDEINRQMQAYLMVQVVTSVIVGIATGLAFWALGLEHAIVWGIVAAVLNLIPYLGSLLLMAVSMLVAFLQFGQIEMAIWIGVVSLVIHTITGQLLTPWMTGRASRMNPVAVFVGVLAFGWLWGVWGLLLGVPILMIVKAVCDRVENLRAIGELLGS
jgi:predicted PurR-regulated permease PerM